MTTLTFALALLLLLIGGWLYIRSLRQRRATGLPAGEIVYIDAGDWRRNEKPLFSSRYGLVGKPDYLVAVDHETIPVEIKSSRLSGADPYPSHKLQLAAYCLLVEDTTGVRPSHGILQYANTAVRLPFTDAIRREVLNTLDDMRAALDRSDVKRSHNEPARCARCGYQHACGREALPTA